MDIKQCDNSYYSLTQDQTELLEKYENLIKAWNGLNLIAKSTVDDVFGWHILDALSIMCIIKNCADYTLIDFGSGGGVLGASLHFAGIKNIVLVERSKVKFEFLKNILKFPSVLTSCNKAAEPALLLSRGVSSMHKVLDQAKFKFDKAIFFTAWDIRDELRDCKRDWHFNYSIYSRQAFADGKIVLLEDIVKK